VIAYWSGLAYFYIMESNQFLFYKLNDSVFGDISLLK